MFFLLSVQVFCNLDNPKTGFVPGELEIKPEEVNQREHKANTENTMNKNLSWPRMNTDKH